MCRHVTSTTFPLTVDTHTLRDRLNCDSFFDINPTSARPLHTSEQPQQQPHDTNMSSRGEPPQEREGEDAPSSSPERKRKSADEEAKTEESNLGETEPRQLSKQPRQQQPQLIQQQQQQPQPTGHGGPLGGAPPFNATDDALSVFSQPFFEPYRHLTEKRNRELGGRTIHEVLRPFFDGTEGIDPLGRLSQEMGVRFASVRKYYETADLVTKQQFAAARMKAKYACDFQEAEISNAAIDSSLRPLRPLLPVDEDGGDDIAQRTIDLSFLADLRSTTGDTFFPSKKLYVRDCMRFIFGLFHEDATATKPRRPPSNRNAAVLIGSPGVGKSILMFLAALDQAMRSPVVYYRKVRDELVSVFFMTPPDDVDVDDDGSPKKVQVWFTRNMDSMTLAQGLKSVAHDLVMCGIVDKKVCYTFIDGPTLPRENNAAQTQDTIDGNFDYFCTSGGFRGFAEEQTEKRLWVLDGWSVDDAVAALSLRGQNEEQAEAVFALCGGGIRRMILATRNAQGVRRDQDALVKALSTSSVDIFVSSTERSNDPKHPDRLRTMFELRQNDDEGSRKKRMLAYQTVDSRYAFQLICTLIEMRRFFTAYRLAETSELRAGQGVFFEHIVHRWAESSKTRNEIRCFHEVCWSSGTIKECVDELATENVYWIPSKQNFPAIDSALVHNHTLYVFHMTISDTHTFDRATFNSIFFDKVRVKFRLHRVVLLFVHPQEVAFRLPNDLLAIPPLRRFRSRVGFVARTLASRVGAQALVGEARHPHFECRAFGVNTRGEVEIADSLMELFRGL
jgi:hypothetical protein